MRHDGRPTLLDQPPELRYTSQRLLELTFRKPIARLQYRRQKLLDQDRVRGRWGSDGLDIARSEQLNERSALEQAGVRGREEQGVASQTFAAARPAQALKKRSHGCGRIDLDDPVQITDVQAQLERARGDDHAVLPLGKRPLGLPSSIGRKRGVRDEGVHSVRAQRLSEILDTAAAVAEHEPLLAPVQLADDGSRIVQRAHVVDGEIDFRRWGTDADQLALAGTMTRQPVEQRLANPSTDGGWNPAQRVQAIAGACTNAESRQGWPVPQLIPLLAAAHEELPWVLQWHNQIDPELGVRLGDYFREWLAAELQKHALTREDLAKWRPERAARRRSLRAAAV